MLGTILVTALAATPGAWSWSFATSGHPTVAVSNVHGGIRIAAGPAGQVTVRGELRPGTGADPWKVEARQVGEEIRVRVCCGPCRESDWNRDCSQGGVELTLAVPSEASLDVSSVSAPVRIENVRGEQQISTVSGAVDSTGSAAALKVSAVTARVVLVPQVVAETEVSSVSGTVKLQLPRGAGAEVSFSTLGGRFNGQGASGSATRTFGDGKIPIAVSTVGGELQVDAQG